LLFSLFKVGTSPIGLENFELFGDWVNVNFLGNGLCFDVWTLFLFHKLRGIYPLLTTIPEAFSLLGFHLNEGEQ
jgi:hypothetical protein